jgi:hypothetical protein
MPGVLYLNRCVDDCVVTAGATSDARTDTSSVVGSGTLSALPRLDLAWADLVLCVDAALGPYDVEVVTEPPAAGVAHVEVMIAGLPEEVSMPADLLGIAPDGDCAPIDHGLGFVFGNQWDIAADPTLAFEQCYETLNVAGRLWGLEPTAECRDAMRLSGEFCDVRPWFTRMELGTTGSCRTLQDGHAELLAVLGEGDAPPPPGVTITSPDPGATVEAIEVRASIEPGRPLDRVELWIDDALADTLEVDSDATEVTLRGDADLGEHAVEVRAFDDSDRMGGASIALTREDGGGCSAAPDPSLALALAIALLAARARSGRSAHEALPPPQHLPHRRRL